MTDNLPAVAQQQQQLATTHADTDSWVDVVRAVSLLAQQIADTEFVPKGLRGSAPATTAAILYGREVGLPPMTSLTMTHVVEGRPGISAEGMRALVYAAGHEIEFLETTGAVCKMRARRRGGERWVELQWNIDQARAAGLAHKNNWKAYPRDMLIARCTAALCRMVFPDVIHGFRAIEELEDMSDLDTGPTGVEAPAQGTTKVTRKRTTARTARKSSPPELAQRPEAAQDLPLPGEEGYDGLTPAERAAEPAQTPAGGERSGAGSDAVEDGSDAPGEAAEPSPPAGPDQVEAELDVESAASAPPEPEGPPAEATEQPRRNADDGKPITRAQQRALMAQLNGFGLTGDADRDERLNIVGTIVEREVDSTSKLTKGEASTLIDTLARFRDRTGLYEFLDALDQDRQQRAELEGEG